MADMENWDSGEHEGSPDSLFTLPTSEETFIGELFVKEDDDIYLDSWAPRNLANHRDVARAQHKGTGGVSFEDLLLDSVLIEPCRHLTQSKTSQGR